MLKNYFKIAARNLFRNKAYSFINIVGLTLGITCCSLLLMFVIDETSFDSFHSKKDQIFRIIEEDDSENETRFYASTSPPVAKTLVEDYPEVIDATRLFRFFGHVNFSKGDSKYQERSYYVADSNFFDVFDFELLHGDPNTALSKPDAMVIDQEWAEVLFGGENPIGKTVSMGFGQDPSVVTGVLKKVPQNSHIQMRMLLSLPTNVDQLQTYLNSWEQYGASTYLVMQDGVTTESLTNQTPQFIKKYFGEDSKRKFQFQALNDIHFESEHIEFGADDNKGQIEYIYIFMAIGIFMIVIACINYMNLATAKSLHRGKEIGMRKVSGASRRQLVTQFLSESTLTALISFALSIGLVDLLLPYFNQITGKAFVFNSETFSGVFGLLFAITIIVGLLSGSYPALLLSRLQPARVLKGEMSSGKGSLLLRKSLVITQFSLSIIMIIATVVASEQMSFIKNKSMGFDNDQLLVIDINSANVRRRFETMKTEFAKSPYIEKVAASSRVPGEWKGIREVYMKNIEVASVDSIRTYYICFDKDVIDTYNMEILEGNNFSGNPSSDSLTVMINEKAAEMLSLTNPVGATIEISNEDGNGQYRIVGLIKDFNFQSLHNEIAPIILGYRSSIFHAVDYFTLKIDGTHTKEALAHAATVHGMFDQNTPMEYHFLDQQWAEFYKNDERAGNIFMIGASITILIACLGLFGLASFIVQKRTKEIGVRKVLGASMAQLFILLSKTFVLQVGIAFLIAVPISWYFMSSWLNTFAFKFDLGVSQFVLAGGSALLIAILSVSYRVIKAALLNPATTLKNE